MRSPRRWQLFWKGMVLMLALGAAGAYVWQAHHRSVLRHLSGTKRPDYLIQDPAMRLSGTKNITQPVFSTRKLGEHDQGIPETIWPPSAMEPSSAALRQPLDYPGYPPPAEGDVDGGSEIFTSTKSGVPLIKVPSAKP